MSLETGHPGYNRIIRSSNLDIRGPKMAVHIDRLRTKKVETPRPYIQRSSELAYRRSITDVMNKMYWLLSNS